MNRVAPSPVPPGEDLDVLLGAFFKGQMPAPWPAFRPPVRARTLVFRERQPAWPFRFAPGSRFSLVASVALLLCAAWLLGGKFSSPSAALLPDLKPGTADRKQTFPLLPQAPVEDSLPEVKLPADREGIRTTLEQGKDGRTGIRIDVPAPPSNK